ncbi:MAG: FkbM family methyltransferase, partial [Clostridia bacterium]|nr:FkbM family methyltransferase [Clostridia bacterium]
FDKDYVRSHSDELCDARSMLSDDKSRALFDDSVMYRLTGKYKYLLRTQDVINTYKELFSPSLEYIIDCGAYRGDSAQTFAAAFPNVKRITALEPDAGSFAKLKIASAKIESERGVRVMPVCAAVSDSCREETFFGSSSRGAAIDGASHRAKKRTVKCVTIDSVSDGRCDLIKLDVEGEEERALDGASETVKECAPSLAVSLYHRTDDIWKLPLMIKEMTKHYGKASYYLRRPRCVPCWDLTLFALKEN